MERFFGGSLSQETPLAHQNKYIYIYINRKPPLQKSFVAKKKHLQRNRPGKKTKTKKTSRFGGRKKLKIPVDLGTCLRTPWSWYQINMTLLVFNSATATKPLWSKPLWHSTVLAGYSNKDSSNGLLKAYHNPHRTGYYNHPSFIIFSKYIYIVYITMVLDGCMVTPHMTLLFSTVLKFPCQIS